MFRPTKRPKAVEPPPARTLRPAETRLIITLVTPRAAAPLIVPFSARCEIGCGGASHIDLAPHGAAAHGVVPSHAVFYAADDALYVEASDHPGARTRINGVVIAPGRVYLLRRGDELELGTLCLTARLVIA